MRKSTLSSISEYSCFLFYFISILESEFILCWTCAKAHFSSVSEYSCFLFFFYLYFWKDIHSLLDTLSSVSEYSCFLFFLTQRSQSSFTHGAQWQMTLPQLRRTQCFFRRLSLIPTAKFRAPCTMTNSSPHLSHTHTHTNFSLSLSPNIF